MYVEPTKAIKHCLKTLENYRLIVVTGEAGSGKTRFGLELMSRMQNKHQNLTALILTKCNQWDILDLTKKYIFFIDDLLGKYITDDGIYHSWGTAFNPMLKLLNKGNVYFIFALRNYIWYLMKDKLSDYTLFRLSDSSNALVDLSGVEFGMTSQEKLRMLKKFCRHYDVHVCKALQEERRSFECPDDTSISLSEETLKSIANMDTTSGFPFLCEKFFSQKKSLKKSSYFFKDYSAQNFVKEQVDQLLYEKKYLQYVLLVFLFLKNKSFEVNGLLKVKKEIVGIGLVKCTEIMPATIRGCLKEMLNKFISSSDDVFNLKHKVVYEAVLLSFGENFPEKFLDLISKSVLFTYVRSWGYVLEKQEVIVQLDEDMTESLAKKLIDVYGSNKDEAYSDVYRHPSFQDKKLVDCFLDILEGEESFQVFLNLFLAGACKEKNDILATEVIKRFFNSYEFESDILDLVLNNDLIHTFRQYMDHSGYIKLFSEFYAESSGESYAFDFFMKAVRYGARQCIMDMLNYFDTEDDLDTDYDIENMRYILADVCDHIPSLMEILSHHNPSCGYDWTDVLTKLAKLYPCLENRNNFYRNVILFSIISNKLDIALKILEMIELVSNKIVKWLVLGIFIWNKTGFLNTMCKILKDVHFQIDSVEAARLCISCVECNGNEKLLNEFLNAFTCNFQVGVGLKTILHVCEAQNFSDAILLNLIQRPEGKIMFSLVDDKGRTPVQCRAVYKKVRPVDVASSNHHCVRDIDWRDDTLVMYSPIKKVHVIDIVWRDDTLVARSVVKHCMYLGQNE